MTITIDFYNPAHIAISSVIVFGLLLNTIAAIEEDYIYSIITTIILMIVSGCAAIGSIGYLLFFAITKLA